ncbi:MAG: ABC transporter substrate-binding protein [Oscillospiraceae bacterium]|nr:ABC transporter substrate-binding protein [Oscillospiraceae bacterium]
MRKLLSLLLALLCALALTACSEVEEEESFEEGLVSEETPAQEVQPLAQTFALPHLSSQTLDPVTCVDGVPQTLGSLLYEGLFTLDAQFEPQPTLCVEHSYDSETLTYRFTLRDDALFSDGSPLRAADVLATLRRAQESERYAARFASVTSMRAADAQTLVITLSEDNAFFPALLDIPIVKSGTESDLVPLGTGPYLFTNDASGAALTANPNWWRSKNLPLARIPLVSAKDNSTAAHLFAAHNVQLLCSDLTGSEPAAVGGDIALTEVSGSTMQFLGFNFANSLLSNASMRSAMSAALDRADLTSAYLLGHAEPTQFPVHPKSARYPLSLEQPLSSDAYRTALGEAGVSEEKPRKLTMIVNSENAFKVAVAERIATTLSTGGLSVTLKTLKWSDYLAALQAGNFDLYYGEVRLTADWNCTTLVHTLGSLNYGHCGSAEDDALLATFLAGTSDTFLSRFAREVPFAPIAFKSVSVLAPQGMIETLSPTTNCVFYGIENWTFRLDQ